MGFLSLVIFLEKKKRMKGENENKGSQQQGMLPGNLKVQAWEQQPRRLARAVHGNVRLSGSSRLTGLERSNPSPVAGAGLRQSQKRCFC